MGYSSRYHVASLAAVFLALAVGILIGSEVGGDILNETRRDLEKSLNEDLDKTRAENERLRRELGWSDELGVSASLPLVDGRLDGLRIGLVGFGSLPDSVTGAVDEALRPTGARVVAVGTVREPPSPEALAESLSGTGFEDLDRQKGGLLDYGRTVGRQMVVGGPIFRLSRSELMSRSSGSFGRLDAVVLFRGPLPEGDAGSPDRLKARALASSIVAGMGTTRARLVGVEELETRPSGVRFFTARRVPSIDSVDLASGRLSLVFAIDGADGSFGVKETADSLTPQPLVAPDRKPSGRG
jgi:hypothetical protein